MDLAALQGIGRPDTLEVRQGSVWSDSKYLSTRLES